MTADAVLSPTATTIVLWVMCAVVVGTLVVKSWPGARRFFGFTDALDVFEFFEKYR